MPLEIEKKFLLKRVPTIKFDKVLQIQQYYCKDNSRIRKIIDAKKGKITYIRTIKKARPDLGMGVYDETETFLTEKEFNIALQKANFSIHKTRFIKKINKKIKWEIDSFQQFNLVVAEIELPTLKYKFDIPKFIKDNLIMEVTGFNQFTNKSLASKYAYDRSPR